MGWFDRTIEKAVTNGVNRAIEQAWSDGRFDNAIEKVVIDRIRNHAGDFSRDGFVLRIAVALLDASTPRLPWQEAKQLAVNIYKEFRRDNAGVKFGDADFDWDAAAAVTLAEEYEIQHWEQSDGE